MRDNGLLGHENRTILPLEELLKEEVYQRFVKSDKYLPVPFLHLAYWFQMNPT